MDESKALAPHQFRELMDPFWGELRQLRDEVSSLKQGGGLAHMHIAGKHADGSLSTNDIFAERFSREQMGVTYYDIQGHVMRTEWRERIEAGNDE